MLQTHAQADESILISTLNQTLDPFDRAQMDGADFAYIGSQFKTAASMTSLSAASFRIANYEPLMFDPTLPLIPSVSSDNSGVPGSVVGSFNSFTVPGAPDDLSAPTVGTYSTTSSGINLSANTKYWIVLKLNSVVNAPFPLVWRSTVNSTTDAGSIFSSGPSTTIYTGNGTNWQAVSGSSKETLYSLSGTIVPEPGTISLLALGGVLSALLMTRRRQ